MKLFLLDAYALIFRAYYALIKMPRFTSGGFNTSAIFGFVGTLEDLFKKEQPTHMAVCFDPAGPTFRHEAYKDYKGERDATPEDIKAAIPIIKEIIRAYGIPILEVPGFEADDVIGTMSRLADAAGLTTYIMSPDKDFGQLVTPNVIQYKPSYRGADMELRGVEEVCRRFHVTEPRQVIDYLALVGDKIDNIPGCPGVGDKTAISLIEKFGTVDNLIKRTDELKGALKKKVEENAEQIVFSKYLATIKTDVPLDVLPMDLKVGEADRSKLFAIFDELEFRALQKRVAARLDGAEPPKPAPAPKQAPLPSLFDDDRTETQREANAYVAPAPVPLAEMQAIEGEIDKQMEYIHRAGRCAIFTLTDDPASDFSGWPMAWAVVIPGGGYSFIPGGNTPQGRAGARAVAELYADPALLCISADVKLDYVKISQLLPPDYIQNRPFTPVNYYDITLAHYLLDPDTRHTLEHLASTTLGVSVREYDDIAGSGRARLRFDQIPRCDLQKWSLERAAVTLKLYDPLCRAVFAEGLDPLLREVELPLATVLGDMELAGVRIDPDALRQGADTIESRLADLAQEIYHLAGMEFNIGSPSKVGEVLFDHLGLDPKAKRTKSGNYSTSEDVLEKLAHLHPVVSKILEYRQMKKLLNTYLLNLPGYAMPGTNKIHTTFNQTVTATGRISSSEPNLQNIPVRDEMGREIRRAFIADPGHLFLSADYSQIELRLAADFSGDPVLINAFQEGKDIHAITAAKIFHEDVASVTADQRRRAKVANFGILYGISAFGLAQRLSIPRAEGKELIEGYFKSFPTIRAFMDESIQHAQDNGYVTTIRGRKRRLPDIKSRNPVVRGYAERNAINAPIQGSAADIIKIAMVAIHREMRERSLTSTMILQIHDELCFDVVPEELETLRELVVRHMESAYTGRVHLDVSVGVGTNWLDAH